MTPPSLLIRILAVFAVIFGLMTLFSGGAVLFGGEEARAAAGAYVPFVVWFNFLSGFAYIAAGGGLLARASWAAPLAVLIAAALLVVDAAFVVHVAAGGAFETRTAAALIFRTLVWIAIAAFVCPRMSCLRKAAIAR